ncbi:MAG: esterase family protein [Coprococcus sp.]|nr:esterase family protein [Coprococcus sp.]
MALIHYNFKSSILIQNIDVMMILPDVDWEKEKGDRKYQTLYLLHGGGEDYTSYIRYTNIETWANERKLAVVMPTGVNSSYMDMAHGQRYYTYLSEELPSVMQHVFPLSTKKESHFVMGFSMGGMGAMHWSFDHPEFFAAAAFMSGGGEFVKATEYINPGIPAPENDIFHAPFGGIDKVAGSEGDVKMLVDRMTAAYPKEMWPRFFSTTGKEDFMLTSSYEFANYMKSLGIDITFHAGDGGHDWGYWNTWIPKILDWFQLAGSLVEA